MYTEERPVYFQQLHFRVKVEANGKKSIIRSFVTFIVLKIFMSLPALRMMKWTGHVAQMSVMKYACTHVKVKVKFTLEQATKVQRGSRGIALLFL
jgi:hypothetical protein